MKNNIREALPEIGRLCALAEANGAIDPALYEKYDVKRGLRDINGNGVPAGLTNISRIVAFDSSSGKQVPCEGQLYYRGVNVRDLAAGCTEGGYFGFEEAAYLLLFGELPDRAALGDFTALLGSLRSLPKNFVRDVVMKAPSGDLMNMLARSVLMLYSYDDRADDLTPENVLRQSLQLTALIPMLSVYGWQSYNYYKLHRSLVIHTPDEKMSCAENMLALLRPDGSFTPLEARVLDLALLLHAEHGGGNNSTFTARVVTSSGTDTYSACAAALCSLKGPRHGGANVKVVKMFEDLERSVSDWADEDEIKNYLNGLLEKRNFDRSGLIYGMGHAVYSLSDPRADILRGLVRELSSAKGLAEEYALYSRVERLAPEVIGARRRIYKGVSANVDFYSGFAYRMLGIPPELFTPIFASARIVGWSAHRMEELLGGGKIIRPAYIAVRPERKYTPIGER